MKKQFSKRKLISRFLMTPLLIAGVAFSMLNLRSESQQLNEVVETLNSDVKAYDDSSYVESGVSFKINAPNPISFDTEGKATISFMVEREDGVDWTDFVKSLITFRIIFEDDTTTYGETYLGEITLDDSSFESYFTTSASSTEKTATYTSKPLNLFQETGYNFQQNENYQFRIYWEGEDVGRTPQYTLPKSFTYGVSAPVISYELYSGYEQALVEADILLYGALLDAFELDSYITSVYSMFQISWEDQVNQDLVILTNENPGSTLLPSTKIIVDTSSSKNMIKLYLMYDNLDDGDQIDVNIDFKLSEEFAFVEGHSEYSAEFHSTQYEVPTILDIDPSNIVVNDFNKLTDKEDYDLYGGVTVPFVTKWLDKKFPTKWASIDTDFDGTHFTPEITFKKIIESVTIESIKNNSGAGGIGVEVDPSTVVISNGSVEENWNTTDPENVTKTTDVYFENLELGKNYDVSLKIQLANPEMWEGNTEFVTNTINFTVPDKIEEPSIKITDIETPKDEDGNIVNNPANWNELAVSFEVAKPESWGPTGNNMSGYAGIKPDEVFDHFEILAMTSSIDEDGNVIYDESTAITKVVSPSTLSFGDNTVVINGLNSEFEYGIKVVGMVNSTYSRMFGYENLTGNSIESDIISSNTRSKAQQPLITLNTDLHDEYDPTENSKAYTVGFYIDNPSDGSWNFITDESDPESAFYYKNIINNVYVTNVYSETDTSSASADTLYNKKFYVNNTNPGEASSSTKLDDLNIANATNDLSNANSITIDGLNSTWLYEGNLVVELTSSAVDAAQGWIDLDSNAIKIDFNFTPGHPVKAPTVSIDSIDTAQTNYDRHTATVKGSINIDKLVLPTVDPDGNPYSATKREYFETAVLPDAKITSNIWLEAKGDIYSQKAPSEWISFLPSFGDAATDPDNYFDSATNTYHFTFTFENLEANLDYDLVIENTEDFGFIEDVTDVTDSFHTELNETLTQSDLSVYFTNFEYGNQNEATNQYETIQVNLNQVVTGVIEDYPEYYDDLSKNITSLEIVDTLNGEVFATFDPAIISDLTVDEDIDGNPTGFGDISADLVNPVGPKEEINLADYSLVVGTDDTTTVSVPPIKLDSISATPTITTGGLDAPIIKDVEGYAFRDSVKFDWKVSHMNNIKSAKFELYEKEPNPLAEARVVLTENFTESDFISTDDNDWEGHTEYYDPVSNAEYWGVLTITPLSTCEDDPSFVDTFESDHFTGAEIFDFTFDIESVATTTDSIIIDYSWTENTGTVVSDIQFNVIDTYAPVAEGEEQPVIFTEDVDILPSSNGNAINGSKNITINNYNLISGYELYSNQQYEVDIEYKVEGALGTFKPISAVLEDPSDIDLLDPSTQAKEDAFVDSVITSNEESSPLDVETTENSFAFQYNWNNRTIDNDINKNVTYNSIRLYKDGAISEDTLVWESDNLVDTIPGESGTTEVFEVHNEDTSIGGKETVGSVPLEVIPNAKFIIVPYVEYDVYENNSREIETELRSTQKNVKIPFAATEISFNEANTGFIDNDSATVGYHFEKATAFTLSDENYLEIFVADSNGQPHDVIYNGTLYDGADGVKIYSDEVVALQSWTHNTDAENDFADFEITLDGVLTPFTNSITISSLVHIENSDGSVNERDASIDITNNTDQNQYPFIESSDMGVLNRVEVLGEYWDYEIRVESNFAINDFRDVVISEVDLPNSSATEIEVLDPAQVATEFEYNKNNLYLRVEKSLVGDAEYNDLSFLVGRYIGVDATNFTTGSSPTAKSGTAWDGYDWFAIDDFFWLYPPKTAGEIILAIIIWLLIILAILLAIALIGGTGYYIFRITFSNKKWYPIVETIANEKFAVFTDYVDNFGWTQKFQEYADLKDKNIKELREYALKMNIPITFDLTRKELLKTVSLLTDDEIEKFDTFTDDDIDVRNYEILDHWKVARYKKYNFWIKYKMSKMEERGVLNADDDRLETIQAQMEFIEKEKAAHEEREQMFEDIKNLVAEVLDTNVELTSEFSADPLSEFKKELEDKANQEMARKEAEEAEIRAAVDAEERARLEAEAEEQRKIDEKNEKEVKALKTKLAFDYKKIVVNIASFNKGASKKVVGAEAAREVTEKLSLERNKINKLMEIFRQREERIVKLGGEPDAYAFETLDKVDIQVELTKLEKFEQELEGMTKQGLIDKAKKLKLEVKVSWSKDQLMKDMLEQVKERGDFND